MALIRNNAVVGSRIAVELSKLQRDHVDSSQPDLHQNHAPRPPVASSHPKEARLLVIGSAAVDVASRQASKQSVISGTTVPGSITVAAGGVGRNIAETAFRLGVEDVALMSPIGDDQWAGMLRGTMEGSGMRTDALIEKKGKATSVCSLVHDDKGDLMHGVADMDIVEGLGNDDIQQALDRYKPKVVCVDGNLSASTLQGTLDLCRRRQIQTVFEPTSNPKAVRILPAFGALFSPKSPVLSLMVPNLFELEAVTSALRSSDDALLSSLEWFKAVDELGLDTGFRATVDRQLPDWVTQAGALQMAVQLLPAVGTVMAKNGAKGILVVRRVRETSEWKECEWVVSKGGLVTRHFPPTEELTNEVTNVNGAGDTVCGAVLAGLAAGLRLESPHDVQTLIDVAQSAAIRTIQSSAAVGDVGDLRPRLWKR